MPQRKSLKNFLNCRQAAVTIEFVVTIPLFLAALAFSFEFGQLFLAHQSTVNNVRSAARYLARTDLTTGDYRRANNIIRTGQVSGGVTPDYMAGECEQAFACATPPDDGEIRISVRVDYRLTLFSFFIDDDGPGTIPFVVREDVRWVGM